MANDDRYIAQCPHCRADLVDPRPGPDGRTYYRTISIEVRGVYDGGLMWQCPDCGLRWHRWPPGHHLRRRAHDYLRAWNGGD